MIPVRQSTARAFIIGPVLDADGVAVTDSVIGDFKISKNGAAPAALDGSATLVHRHTGSYSLTYTANDVDTVGSAQITCDDTVNACAPLCLQVMEEVIYDAIYAASANTFSGAAGSTTLTALATGSVTAAVIADGAIDAATFAADVDAEILSYIVDDATRIDASDLNSKIDSMTFTVAGDLDVNVQTWGGTAIATPPAVNATQISGSATAADNLEIVFDTDFATAYDAANQHWNCDVVQISGSTAAADNLEIVFSTDFATNYSTTADKWQVQADLQTIKTQAVTCAAGVTVGVYVGGTGAAALEVTAQAILDDTGTAGVVVASGSKTGYSLTANTGLGNQTADITGNLSGSVGSVTGNVGGNVVGSVGSVIAGVTVSTNNDKSGYSLSVAGVNAVADQVWVEAIADHSGTVGSTAEALAAAGSAGDPWATALPGAYGAGTAGFILGTNLDAAISSRSSHSAADIWAVGARTLTAATNITSTGGTITLTAGAVTVGTNNDKTGYSLTQAFPANFASMAITAGGALTIGTNSDKTGYALSTAGLAAFFTTNSGQTYGTSVAGSVVKEIADNTAAAGDPWSTLLPGAYGAGTAGFILGTNLDAAVSSRPTAAQIDAQLSGTHGAGTWETGVGGVAGPGAISTTICIKLDNGTSVANAEVWVSTDLAGSNVIAGTLTTNSFGKVTFMLDAGTYYVWRQKPGVNFDNPESITVT